MKVTVELYKIGGLEVETCVLNGVRYFRTKPTRGELGPPVWGPWSDGDFAVLGKVDSTYETDATWLARAIERDKRNHGREHEL